MSELFVCTGVLDGGFVMWDLVPSCAIVIVEKIPTCYCNYRVLW